ncbi:MAG: MBL fold metallo-hydrolase, partial [Vulcanimicrobiaceae bacterium]
MTPPTAPDAGRAGVLVVGSSCAIPRPGRACSSYVMDVPAARVAFDFGTGALASLRCHCELEDLDAIVISHMHADHFFDLIPLRYALMYGPRRSARPIPVYLPPGGERMLRGIADQFVAESPRDFFGGVMTIATYDPARALRVGDATIRFAATTHYVTAFALRYEWDAASVTYSADTAPDDSVARFADGSQVFLCEATLGADGTEPSPRGHLNGREAGALAHRAGVGQLLITHYAIEAAPGDLALAAAQTF